MRGVLRYNHDCAGWEKFQLRRIVGKMITQITIENFKRFGEKTVIDLGGEQTHNAFVFVGPNNCGKTTALQALSLWGVGVNAWRGKTPDRQRGRGLTIDLRDLVALPTPYARALWHNEQLRVGQKGVDIKTATSTPTNSDSRTSRPWRDIRITVSGRENNGERWECSMRFYYANPQFFHCNLLTPPIPNFVQNTKLAMLPAMSGLALVEPHSDADWVENLIGQGRTAEVLRNLCYALSEKNHQRWESVKSRLEMMFGVTLNNPKKTGRGDLNLSYVENGVKLDISAAGRGLLQVLLLMCYLYKNPNSLVLLDEPDAHLEILRQREIYSNIAEIARQQKSQVIAATHSEILLQEAVESDTAVAFIGKSPKRIKQARSAETRKALSEIQWSDYLQAEKQGWVLYLEGSSDLSVLQAFAKKLEHKTEVFLRRCFAHYVSNQPTAARKHFHAVQFAAKNLLGIAIYDDIESPLEGGGKLHETKWRQKEIENYFCTRSVLMAYARSADKSPLFQKEMEKAIADVNEARKTLSKPLPFGEESKGSEDFREILNNYAQKTGIAPLSKADYHTLINFMRAEDVDSEVREKLDAIASVAQQAGNETSARTGMAD